LKSTQRAPPTITRIRAWEGVIPKDIIKGIEEELGFLSPSVI
jgi:superfamily II DNA/RNA helicase